jgi:hypothetical protein
VTGAHAGHLLTVRKQLSFASPATSSSRSLLARSNVLDVYAPLSRLGLDGAAPGDFTSQSLSQSGDSNDNAINTAGPSTSCASWCWVTRCSSVLAILGKPVSRGPGCAVAHLCCKPTALPQGCLLPRKLTCRQHQPVMQAVGGLMLHLQRKSSQPSCQDAFAKLVLYCSDAVVDTAVSAQGRAYGLDPAFNALSPLYDPDVTASKGDFYNVSSGSSEVDSLGQPYGFFVRAMPGQPLGYPVVFPVRCPAA